MYRVPPAGPAWHAVGARLERGVRQRAAVVAVQTKSSRSNFGALTRQSRWRPAVMASRGDGSPALTRAGTGAPTSLRHCRVTAELVKKRDETLRIYGLMSRSEATWLSRIEAHKCCLVVLPNVRAKRAAPAGRQARAGENVPRTARPGLVACRGRSSCARG